MEGGPGQVGAELNSFAAALRLTPKQHGDARALASIAMREMGALLGREPTGFGGDDGGGRRSDGASGQVQR